MAPGSPRRTRPASSSGSSWVALTRSGPREGIGLGLPTALAIAQAHGGTIDVRSKLGHGSTFTLIVPTAGPEDEG